MTPRIPIDNHASPDPTRRLLLTGLLASSVASFMPKASAQTGAASPDFIAVSQLLTNRVPDSQQAAALHAALVATVPGFDASLRDLRGFIANNGSTADSLQAALDTAKAPFARLPGTIATAWYVGTAGSGVAARCVTYESSLMNTVVADRLKPPSYAYGPYGSWRRAPVTVSAVAAVVDKRDLSGNKHV